MSETPAPPLRRASTALRLVPVILGIMGLIGSAALGAINGHFTSLHFGLGGVSILAMIGGLFWLREVAWKQTLSAIVYSVFVLFCLSLVYLISANRQHRFDITRDQIHTLSPLTKSVLAAIPSDHQVIAQAFLPSSQHGQMTRLLSNYRRETPNFAHELYDPDRDIDVVMQLGGTVQRGSLYVTHIDRDGQIVAREERRDFNLTNPLRESALTNAIAQTLQDQEKRFYYVTGHGEKRLDDSESSLTQAATLVSNASFPVEGLRLAEGRIPLSAAAVIIAGPTRDISDFERELLENYLREGGDLFLMIDPVMAGGEPLTNLELLLERVAGIRALNRMVIDPTSANVTGYTFTPQALWAVHDITRATNRVPLNLIRARPILASPTPPEGVKHEGVLASNDRSWSEPAGDLRSTNRLVPPMDPDSIHTQTLAATATRPTPGGRHGEEMRLLVVGDSEGFTNRHLERNGDAALFVLQGLNWLRGEEDMLQVPPRTLTSTPITLNNTTAWMLAGIYLGLGLLVTLGGTAWTLARRRNK